MYLRVNVYITIITSYFIKVKDFTLFLHFKWGIIKARNAKEDIWKIWIK